MAKRLRSYVRTAAIVAAAAVAFAALLFLPPVDRALGGLFARSADGATVARYPEQLRGELARHERGYVDYADIPATLEQALISVEDKRFLQHGGIDPIALVRALAQDAQNDHVDHGGATIPLQLARMILQIPRRQPSAIAELTSQLRVMHAALIVEHDFSKQKILELYLNGVYLGHGATGVAAAAEAYFHVPVGQLNEAQCIYMAGLPNNPGRFGADPSGDAAMARYRHVIATMVHNGYLTVPKAAALNRAQLFGAR
ncbi:MAG TPA: biosynthetic peptidoglycan transglycosylase [Xanthobacteraceae bacterium]|nr:biosynthetic peptidoglycan transglycosylase [Xanthobacteraceae bacterium]